MARSSSAPATQRATKPAGRRAAPSPEERHHSRLVDSMVATGRYTRAVAERILARMPHALDGIPARVTDEVEVTTGFGTKWLYAIHKVAGGYSVSFRPLDVEKRRKSGMGHTGGFISGTSLSQAPKVYRTQKDAYAAIVDHAKRGQYLLYKNNPREGSERWEFKGLRPGYEDTSMEALRLKPTMREKGREYARHNAEAEREQNLTLRLRHLAKAKAVKSEVEDIVEDVAERSDNASRTRRVLFGEFRAASETRANPKKRRNTSKSRR